MASCVQTMLLPYNPVHLGIEHEWTKQDELFSLLFKPWDELPTIDPSKETKLLRKLDSIITPFEAHIHHSHTGFRRWIKRHQLAMEMVLTETPTWPKLQRRKRGRLTWDNEAWGRRYRYMVQQRDVIAAARLRQVACCSDHNIRLFFGHGETSARATLRSKMCDTWRLKLRRYKSIDMLLEYLVQLEHNKPDFAIIRQQFWGDAHAVNHDNENDLSEVESV